MKRKIKKELIHYYIEKEKYKDSKTHYGKIKLNIINMMIKRINLILKLSKYVSINKLIKYESKKLNSNLSKNLENKNQLYILKWLEYSKFLDRITNKNINYS